jgi:hypothetical protein
MNEIRKYDNGYYVSEENFKALFINSLELPVKTKHLCYYTKVVQNLDKRDWIELIQVYQAYYKHPQQEDASMYIVLEERTITCQTRNSLIGASIVLLEAAQKAISIAISGFID